MQHVNELSHFRSAIHMHLWILLLFWMDTWHFHFFSIQKKFTQLSQTFNLSLWMAISSVRCSFFSLIVPYDCNARLYFSSKCQFRWSATFCAQFAVDRTQSVWTTVGNECRSHFFFVHSFKSIISDEIYIYNGKIHFPHFIPCLNMVRQQKEKTTKINLDWLCMCMKNFQRE